MLALAVLPILLLMMKCMFFWNDRVDKIIDLVISKLCFNIYIRFGLEAYLELSLSSLLRFENYTFGTSSEKFHTVFATMIFVGLIAFLAFALFFLQWRFDKLASKESK